METNISWGRIFYSCIALFCGIGLFIWGGSFVHNNKELLYLVVILFSVLIGSVLCITLTVGNSIIQLTQDRSWRSTQLLKSIFESLLIRETTLVCLYFSTLLLIFISVLFRNESWIFWIEKTWLAIAGIAMILSIHLPFTIKNIQMERYELLLHEQRKEANVTD